jgi:hypothetical protein
VLLGLFALLWLAVVVSLYYVTHKPFTPALAAALGKAAVQSAAAFALVSAGGGLGLFLLPEPGQHYSPEDALADRPLAAPVLQAGLGLGLLSLAAFCLGATVGINSPLAWAALLVLFGLLRRRILSWWRSWSGLARLWAEADRPGKTLVLLAGAILVFAWITALAPPLKFDALVYHLALPERYLELGRVIPAPEIMFWGMPQVAELLYTWAIALAGQETAAALGWLAGTLALTGLAGLLGPHFGARAAWVAVAVLLCGNSLSAALAWGYVDWWTVLFGVSFLAALARWRGSPAGLSRERALSLAGLYAGLALGTKYSAGVLILGGLAVILWDRRESGLHTILAAGLRFSLPAVLVSLPWWIRNALATGNPFYPFFYPSGAMSAFRLAFFSLPAWGGWDEAFLLPWKATQMGIEGAPGYSASIGPLLLALGPIYWLGWKFLARPAQLLLAAAGLVSLTGLFTWAIASRFSGYLIQSRLYWAVFPALATLAAAGFHALDGLKLPGLRLGRVAAALIITVSGFAAIQMAETVLKSGAPQVLLALRQPEDYLDDNLGWYAPAARAVSGLPEGTRTLMLWEPRSLYCTPGCQPDEVLDRWLSERQAASPAGVLQAWREAGYTHLLYNRFGAEFVRGEDPRYTMEDWQALDSLLGGLPVVQDFGGAYQLYALTP